MTQRLRSVLVPKNPNYIIHVVQVAGCILSSLHPVKIPTRAPLDLHIYYVR